MSAKKATKNTQDNAAHGGCSGVTCSACGGSGLGPAMYRPEIDKTQRDRCYTCKGTGTKAPTDGSMLRCYWAFVEYFPWKKSEFPTYDLWIYSDADDARIFRQGWAARCRSLESLPNDSSSPTAADGAGRAERKHGN